MKVKREDHTFVICAYQESPYLEACILSLKKQTIETNILMVTSTDNETIRSFASAYDIPLFVNPNGGIVEDWNFGLSVAQTPLVTLAHQDDVYEPSYTACMFSMIKKSNNPLLFFSDYGEIRDSQQVKNNRLLKIKRMMLLPLEFSPFSGSVFVRRRILSIGNAICCPSVTFVKTALPDPVFLTGFTCSQDWQAWERISRLKGDFLYAKKLLMYHRIHGESTTSAMLRDTGRSVEDYQMFCKFWPKPIARLLSKLYASSEKSNDL